MWMASLQDKRNRHDDFSWSVIYFCLGSKKANIDQLRELVDLEMGIYIFF